MSQKTHEGNESGDEVVAVSYFVTATIINYNLYACDVLSQARTPVVHTYVPLKRDREFSLHEIIMTDFMKDDHIQCAISKLLHFLYFKTSNLKVINS